MVVQGHVPWWACAGIVLLVVHHPDFLGIDHGFNFVSDSEGTGHTGMDDSLPVPIFAHQQVRRQLWAEEASRALKDDAKEDDTVDDAKDTSADTSEDASERIPDFNISVPCYKIPFVGLLVKPCGNVTIGPKGKDIKTIFGTKHIPGTNTVKPYVKKFEKSFEHYTVFFVGGGVALYALLTAIIPSRREKVIQNVKDAMGGKINPDPDPDEDPADAEADQKARMDPKSNDFIAPGNIYRLLAVLHPGKVGIGTWSKWAFKAFVCAYMQLYLPFKIILTVLGQWQFHGFKSPLWFLEQGGDFTTMFVSVGSLCSLFASKCAESIRVGAEANFFILTHREDPEAEGHSMTLSTEKHGEYAQLKASIPPVPPIIITANEYTWCCLSFACNVAMSFLLFGAMFLKIATFTGQISEVAMVAVSLYFIFDLDDKIMESDPKLRPRYRNAVLKQTQEKDYKPLWLLTIAASTKAIMGFLTPFGLGMIFLFAWKNDNTQIVIGGDPF